CALPISSPHPPALEAAPLVRLSEPLLEKELPRQHQRTVPVSTSRQVSKLPGLPGRVLRRPRAVVPQSTVPRFRATSAIPDRPGPFRRAVAGCPAPLPDFRPHVRQGPPTSIEFSLAS